MKFSKLAMHSIAAMAAMGIFMSGATQTAAAEEWYVYESESVKLFPTVIANDSSQAIAKLLVFARANGSFLGWDKVEKSAAYDSRIGIVRNIAPGQWAQYNLSEDISFDDGSKVDVQVTLADGRVLELDSIDIRTQDVVLTDNGLMAISAAKTPAPMPDDVKPGSNYFHNHQPQGLKDPEPTKDIPSGYAVIDGELVKWGFD